MPLLLFGRDDTVIHKHVEALRRDLVDEVVQLGLVAIELLLRFAEVQIRIAKDVEFLGKRAALCILRDGLADFFASQRTVNEALFEDR